MPPISDMTLKMLVPTLCTIAGTQEEGELREILRSLSNTCNVACGLAKGTNSATLKTQHDVIVTINGAFVAKATTDNVAMTALPAQPAGSSCLYLASVNASGTVAITPGNVVLSGAVVSTVDGNNTWSSTAETPELPPLPVDQAPLGCFKVVTDATHTFTCGTTDLAAAGLTVTYQDLAMMPISGGA